MRRGLIAFAALNGTLVLPCLSHAGQIVAATSWNFYAAHWNTICSTPNWSPPMAAVFGEFYYTGDTIPWRRFIDFRVKGVLPPEPTGWQASATCSWDGPDVRDWMKRVDLPTGDNLPLCPSGYADFSTYTCATLCPEGMEYDAGGECKKSAKKIADQAGVKCPSTKWPISISSGNKYLFELDFEARDVGFDRHYNSVLSRFDFIESINSQNELGFGWSSSAFSRIVSNPLNPDVVWVTRAEGNISSFRRQGNTWLPEEPTRNSLAEIRGADNQRVGWRYVDVARGKVDFYNGAGKLSAIGARDGGRVELVYSDGTDGALSGRGGFVHDLNGMETASVLPAGRLIRLEGVLGGRLNIAWDANGRVKSVSSSDGIKAVIKYTANSDLESIGSVDGDWKRYFYGGGGGLLQGRFLNGVDVGGSPFSSYRYDQFGRAIGEELAGQVDSASLEYSLSPKGFVAQTTVLDALGAHRTYQFSDTYGSSKLTAVNQPAGAGCDASVAAYSYDSNALVREEVKFDGTKICYENDPTARLEKVRLEGVSSSVQCPPTLAGVSISAGQRRVSSQWHPLWPLKTVEASPLKITRWIFNGMPDPTAGDAIARCAPSDAYVYDNVPIAVLCKRVEQATTDGTGALGSGASTTGPRRIWSYTWNRHGQMLTADGPRTDVADVTTYEYYPDTTANWTKGDLKSITNALGHVWQFTRYDAAGRLLSMTDPNGVVTTQTWHPRGWLTSRSVFYATELWAYAPTGLLTEYTPPNGNYLPYTYEYDGAHRLKAITDPVGQRIEYTLDRAGNVEQVDLLDRDGTLARQSRIEHDKLGRPWKRRDAAGNVTEFQHDALGRLNRLIDARSEVTEYRWDALGRLEEILHPRPAALGSEPGPQVQTTQTHDGQDRLTAQVAPNNARTAFTVDGLGNIEQERSSDRGTLTYTYDEAGNVTRRTDDLQRVTEYDWDALDRPVEIRYFPPSASEPGEVVRYTWDTGCVYGRGRLCRVTDGSGTTDYGYSALGGVAVSERRNEGGSVAMGEFFRDAQGRVLYTTDATGFRAYPTRTGDGNIAWLDFEDGRTGDFLPATVTFHTYDGAGQITGARLGEWGSELGFYSAYDLDGRTTESILSVNLPTMTANWTLIYAPVGESVEASVTLGPEEVRGTLLMCRYANHNMPCEGGNLLGQIEVNGGGDYALRSSDALPLGIHSASVRFIGTAPFTNRYLLVQRPIFIGVPPTSLVDDLLH